MIQEIQIGALDRADDTYYEPPTEALNVAVIGGIAHLYLQLLNEDGKLTETSSIRVPARSLLRALHAAIDDDEANTGADLQVKRTRRN